MGNLIDGVILSPLKVIPVDAGNVMHAFKNSDVGYNQFGEAYFSSVKYKHIKAWKRHLRMTLNLIVPVGEISFVLYDNRDNSKTKSHFFAITLSLNNYQRLTVPPDIWMGFQGVNDGLNLLLNIADMPHDPDEVERCEIDDIQYDWSIR